MAISIDCSNAISLENCGDGDTDTYMARGHFPAGNFLESIEEVLDRKLDGVYLRQVAHGFWKNEAGGYTDTNEGDSEAFPVTYITLY